jgi:YYY domain-containing protein
MVNSDKNDTRGRARRGWIALILIAILLLGAAFRFYNVNWDKGTYHIHPDERHTTMVVTAIQWPASLAEYFDTSRSPLNPRNAGSVYFYGTLPLFLTKYVATQLDGLLVVYTELSSGLAEGGAPLPSFTGYDQIHLVGRVLSGLFDLGSVLLLFFLARRLFDWRVGLIASFLLAMAVLNIQGSHYFAVDTFLTFFVQLTIWFTLDVAEGKGWPAFIGLGLSMGLTLAAKVSVFLLALVVVLGAWLWVRRQVSEGRRLRQANLRAAGGLILAALIAIFVFRIAQPYAWAGPNYNGWDTVPEPWGQRMRFFEAVPDPIRAAIMPNPQWVADIVSAGAQQTGEADMPWGRQWTGRAPWLWPLQNTVLWGMGLPLGLAAIFGVAVVAVNLFRAWRARRRLSRAGQHGPEGRATALYPPSALVLIPLAWVLLTFFWQGMQYVKSVRYFLPLYPYLVMFAAYLVVSVWDWAKSRAAAAAPGRRAAGVLAWGLAAFVLAGTLAWAWAFLQIYREPITRVQASRWIYDNVESGATLHYRTAAGETGQLQVPLSSRQVYATDGQWLTTPFTPPEDLFATGVVMNNLTGLEGPRQGSFEVQITAEDPGVEPLAGAQIEATFDGPGTMATVQKQVFDLGSVPLTGGQRYYLGTRPLSGAPLVSLGAGIANEHFDDPLPFNMDGRVAFGSGPYRGLDLALYNEDTPDKLEEVLDVLDEADYISMSSGRLWQSIPRLPMRYPVTTRYYQLLFAEELGFEKAAEFHAYPRLFGIEFDDTWAEEQFTVYDHPKVLIYRKTADYDRERVRELLSDGIDWNNIAHWLNPRDVAEWERANQQQGPQSDLKLTPAQRQVQERGGTWASLFNRKSLANRWPTLTWLLLLAAVGLAALPLTLAILGRLPDCGYILARPVGVLLLAWLSWMLANLTPLGYTRGTIALALALITLLAWGSLLLPSQRRRLADLWRTRKGLILAAELLFLAFFALIWLTRWANPDLWHAWKGGEKPMDFAYLNAVIKSTEFPPYDPWFAGGYLNYYYFGQVMAGTLIKLVGIVPAVAYNLVVPAWFAMTAMGAFSVTYNFVAMGTRPSAANGTEPLRPLFFGAVGALFVTVLGNLGQLPNLLIKLGEGMVQSFHSTIPGLAGLVRVTVGTFDLLFNGRILPMRLDEWYWNPSRAIPSGPYEAVITEFPFFTFLFADLHAHLIAMPLTFLSLAVALAFIKEAGGPAEGGWRGLVRRLAALLLWSLAIGAMRTTNTWDVPPHLIIVFGALVIAAVARFQRARTGRHWLRLAGSVAWQFALVFLLGWWLLYQPFWANYGSFYNSLALWSGTRTVLWAYLVVHGLFLFAIISYLCARVIGDGRQDPLLRRIALTLRYRGRAPRLRRAARIAGVRGLPVSRWLWVLLVLLLLLEIAFIVPGLFPFARPLDAAPEGTPTYVYRGLAVFGLGLPLAVLGLLLLFRARIPPAERFWAYLVLLGLAMTLGVEVIVLEGDIGRMNTIFKFYVQVWLLWGVAAAVALAWMVPRLWRWRTGRGLWLAVLSVLLFIAAIYPPLAIWARVGDRFDTGLGPGLDGLAYMQTAQYGDPAGVYYDLKWDLEAIQWLLDNVVGSPTLIEGHVPEYRWGARYSINTGLPAVLGWNWHQRQQRAGVNDREVWDRAGDIALFYDTRSPEAATAILRRFGVRYVIVGPLERANYDPAGLEKLDAMVAEGTLRTVFSNGEVTIYEVEDGR